MNQVVASNFLWGRVDPALAQKLVNALPRLTDLRRELSNREHLTPCTPFLYSRQVRQAARSDANQQSIIGALRNIGIQVYYIKLPTDLLISGGALGLRNVLLEVKMPGEALNASQQEFWMRWPGEKYVVRTVQEALEAVLGNKLLA